MALFAPVANGLGDAVCGDRYRQHDLVRVATVSIGVRRAMKETDNHAMMNGAKTSPPIHANGCNAERTRACSLDHELQQCNVMILWGGDEYLERLAPRVALAGE